MRRYETSIKELLSAKKNYEEKTGKTVIFLSDWDVSFKNIKIPRFNFADITVREEQKYYFWTDEENFKSNIINCFNKIFSVEIPTESFAITSNGTSSLMVTITALKEKGLSKALVFTPVYFSTLNLLDELDFGVIEFPLSLIDSFKIDFQKLEKTLRNEHINVIIITNPIFGTGVELSVETIKKISLLCNKYGVYLLMDYVYGGLPWNVDKKSCYLFNYPVFEAVKLSNNYIFIESISKRIFLNGIKLSLVFSQQDFMRRMLRISVFMVGSMVIHQVDLVKKIYTLKNQDALVNLISKNAKKAQENYNLIKCILQESSCILSESQCGYFTLVSIPKPTLDTDTDFAINILNKTGVLTIPHSRYLLKEESFYSFRVNLLIDKVDLIEGITKIKNLV